MYEAVEQRRDYNHIVKQLRPVVDGTVRGEDGGQLLVTAHDRIGAPLANAQKEAA